VLSSTNSRAANDTQTSQNGGKKKADNGKKKVGKNGKKGKGGKKGNKKNAKQANKGAQGNATAADGNNRKRSCKCYFSVLLYIMRRSLLTFELGSSRQMGKDA